MFDQVINEVFKTMKMRVIFNKKKCFMFNFMLGL